MSLIYNNGVSLIKMDKLSRKNRMITDNSQMNKYKCLIIIWKKEFNLTKQ